MAPQQYMLIVNTKVVFAQQGAGRSLTLTYNFLNDFEATDSWEDFTNSAKIILPKNTKVLDGNGQVIYIGGTHVNIGGFTGSPLFLQGDKVTISMWYNGFNPFEVFTGYISEVTSKKPFEIDCEDNMYILKQAHAANKVWPSGKYTVETMIQEMITTAGLPFTVNLMTKTNLVYDIGDFRTNNQTIMQVLAELKKLYHFEAYFRGNELRVGSFVYSEQDAVNDGDKVFMFQQNIIDEGTDLNYKRADDIKLSAIVYSINKQELTQTVYQPGEDDSNAAGKKTKKSRLEIFVYNNSLTITPNWVYQIKQPGQKDFAVDTGGERRTLYFWNQTDPGALFQLAVNELNKYYYSGFRGKFTTFGYPYVQQGDNIVLLNNLLPEQNGKYKCKSVKYKGGVGGLRQEIELDYLIARLDANGNTLNSVTNTNGTQLP